MGVQAIFGPSDPTLGTHIHSICDALDIPYLETRIDIISSSLNQQSPREFSINLHPSYDYVNLAFQDVIRYLNWTRIGVLFEKDYGGCTTYYIFGKISKYTKNIQRLL